MVTVAVQPFQSDLSELQAGSVGAQQQVTQAIRDAAAKTGVNFAYLLNKAQQESGGDPNAKASNSSATGLFQFTGQTWLKMVKTYGTQYGLGNYAQHIQIDSSGTAQVSDSVWKKAILGLRKDPQISAEMAGELDKENGASLKASVGGKIGSTELYLAHFLGAGGASDFIKTMRSDPNAKAADILPDAAASNNSVFYDADGNAKSVAQIYQHFARKFDQTPTSANTMLASNTTSTTPANLSPVSSSYIVADAAASRSAYAAALVDQSKSGTSSMFETMVLAQMKMDNAGDDATNARQMLDATSYGSNHNKKNAISILGAIA